MFYRQTEEPLPRPVIATTGDWTGQRYVLFDGCDIIRPVKWHAVATGLFWSATSIRFRA
jgi:hypothetical protein